MAGAEQHTSQRPRDLAPIRPKRRAPNRCRMADQPRDDPVGKASHGWYGRQIEPQHDARRLRNVDGTHASGYCAAPRGWPSMNCFVKHHATGTTTAHELCGARCYCEVGPHSAAGAVAVRAGGVTNCRLRPRFATLAALGRCTRAVLLT
jgi:hypothetical protein